MFKIFAALRSVRFYLTPSKAGGYKQKEGKKFRKLVITSMSIKLEEGLS